MAGKRANGEGSAYRRKDGRWEAAGYVRTAAGRSKRVRCYAKTRAEAVGQLAEIRGRAGRGVPVPDEAWRLSSYLEYWLPIVKRTKRPTTYRTYLGIVNNHLKPGLGGKYLTKLSVHDVQGHLDAQLDRGCSIRMVQKERTVLSSALSRAQREELVMRNVARHIELPAYHRKKIRPWSAEQVAQFLASARDDPLYPAFVVLTHYGLRRGEVLGLRWSDIDLQARTISVERQLQRYEGAFHLDPLKTESSTRVLPLLRTVRTALMAVRPPEVVVGVTEQLVFRTRFENPIEGGNLQRTFDRISANSGLPRIKLHHLRHTAATLLKNLRLPDRDIQLILGHASVNTTRQLYEHADLPGQLHALSQLESTLIAGGVGSRQQQPSSHRKSPSSARATSGGSSQTRTGDTRLFSSFGNSVPTTLTEVNLLGRARYQLMLLGGVAVIRGRQDSP